MTFTRPSSGLQSWNYRLWLSLFYGYLRLPRGEPCDDLIAVYVHRRLAQKWPAVFIAENPLSGLARLYVAVHAPELLPELIEKAVAAQALITRSLPTAGIFTAVAAGDRAASVARLLGRTRGRGGA